MITVHSGARGFYLLIEDMELGDFYRSLSISCTGGRVYFENEHLAETQRKCEQDWQDNNQTNPYTGRYK